MAKKSNKRSATGKGRKGLLEVITVGESVAKRDTKQGSLRTSSISTSSFVALGGVQVEDPPFDMDNWAIAPEFSTRLAACIFIRSQNIGGMGYLLVPTKENARKIEQSKRELKPEELKEIKDIMAEVEKEKQIAEELLENPHDTKPFSSLLREVIADKERIGNGYMAVDGTLIPVGDKEKGFPMGLDRKVGHKIRIKKLTRNGYLVKEGKAFVHYKRWGDKRVIDKRTGKRHDPAEGILPPRFHAKELIHFKLESGRDSEYGIPRHLSTGPAIAGNRFASERNANFFENDATPRIAIIVEGPARLSKESRDDIREFVERKGKGTENTGRVMIIQAGKKEGSFAEKDDVKIKIEKLTVGVSEEAGHLKYQDKSDKEIAEAFGIHPVYFETDASRASANIGRSITLEQSFEPDIVETEYLLNNTIIKRMGLENIQLKLERPKTVDFEGQANILKKLERTGGITPNDVRTFLDKPRFKAAWADFPLPLALQQLKVPATRAEGSTLIDSLMALDETIGKAASALGENEYYDDSDY
jgi:HK97 family phage portal protein